MSFTCIHNGWWLVQSCTEWLRRVLPVTSCRHLSSYWQFMCQWGSSLRFSDLNVLVIWWQLHSAQCTQTLLLCVTQKSQLTVPQLFAWLEDAFCTGVASAMTGESWPVIGWQGISQMLLESASKSCCAVLEVCVWALQGHMSPASFSQP